ncbi:MAG: hypothetical protein LUG12_01145 [Erysipelotrichaceae bacterium]|nr:hypothetical protein [Erysipelotrichaceae bacterium]
MSYKEDLQVQQPILYKILEQTFSSHKIPHAFLLVGKNAHLPAMYIAKSLICENDILACNECNDCRRIDEYKYADFICYNGNDESIKKSHIEYIQKSFDKSSIEGRAKIYMLENIENSSVEAMNSLLKILEEPESEIYAIFTCQNINRVLPTIQSRCQVIQLLPQSKTLLKEQLQNNHLSNDDINILIELFDSYDECQNYINSDVFNSLKSEVYHFVEDLYFYRDNLIINVETHLLKKYKDKNTIQLFLNMLVLSLRDLFHVKHFLPLTYESYRPLYEKIQDDEENILNKINLILDTEFLLSTNANIMLLMDSMMINI